MPDKPNHILSVFYQPIQIFNVRKLFVCFQGLVNRQVSALPVRKEAVGHPKAGFLCQTLPDRNEPLPPLKIDI